MPTSNAPEPPKTSTKEPTIPNTSQNPTTIIPTRSSITTTTTSCLYFLIIIFSIIFNYSNIDLISEQKKYLSHKSKDIKQINITSQQEQDCVLWRRSNDISPTPQKLAYIQRNCS